MTRPLEAQEAVSVCSAPKRFVRVSAGLLVVLAVAAGGVARAGEPENVSVARAAYDRGAKAYNAGQYAIAAREFGVADELSPNPVALRYALQAALVLDDPVLGMKLVLRAEGRDDAELLSTVRDARAKFSRRVGGITLACVDSNGTQAAQPCRARIDGASATGTTWVTPGTHAIEWEGGGMQTARVGAGETVELRAPPRPDTTPKPAPPPNEPRHAEQPVAVHEALSPTFFWVGVGLTTIGVAATVGSGIDTLKKHSDFAAHPTAQGQTAGEAAQLRTNVLLGTTGGLALVTAVLGVFTFVQSPVKLKAYVDLPSHGAGLALDLTYSP